jgi:hypothetical protein
MSAPSAENLTAWGIDPNRLNDLDHLLGKYGEAAVGRHLNHTPETWDRLYGISGLIADLHSRQQFGLSFALGFVHSGCAGESKDCKRSICVDIRTARDGAA